MSRIGLTAIMLVVISATAASACCFFKCCFKSSSSPGAVPADAHVLRAGFTLRIVTIDNQTPVSNDIPNAVDHPQEDIVVESDFDPSLANPELTVIDDTPPPPSKGKDPGKKPTKKYKPIKIEKKPKVKAVVAPAPGPGPGPGPIPDPNFVWLAIYSVDLEANHNYRAYATAGTVTSSTVTFRTKP